LLPLAVAFTVAFVVASGVDVVDGVGVLVTGPVTGAIASTCRNRNSAVWPTSLTIWSAFTPGTAMTMLSLPWVVISGSVTPLPETRDAMICVAWSSLSFVTPPCPAVGLAVSVIDVPPRRSSPSRALSVEVANITP